MKSQKIRHAADIALMAADGEYHSWGPSKQEAFRATMNDVTQSRVDALLLRELCNIQCKPKNVSEIWNDLPTSQINELNWAKLLTQGIGDNWIYLNESLDHNTSLLKFNTLYDYDYDNHLFQEESNKRDFPNYQPCDYYAFRFSRWARLIIDDQFHYANLYSLAGYLTELLDDNDHELIDPLIPHQYVRGNNHGKSKNGGYRWHMHVDANGLEGQLDELRRRWDQYRWQRWIELSQEYLNVEPVAYRTTSQENGELNSSFIFTNEAALKNVRWQYFLADINKIKSDIAVINELEKVELEKARLWLQVSYEDIMENFDPTVIKFKAKRKLVIAPNIFDLIDREDDEE